jgi:hypothetical protein
MINELRIHPKFAHVARPETASHPLLDSSTERTSKRSSSSDTLSILRKFAALHFHYIRERGIIDLLISR